LTVYEFYYKTITQIISDKKKQMTSHKNGYITSEPIQITAQQS